MTTPITTQARARLNKRYAELKKRNTLLREEGDEWAEELRSERRDPPPAAVSLVETLSDRERHELREVEAALGRLQAGVYGICEECGHPIGAKRLGALPEARLCLPCSQVAAGV